MSASLVGSEMCIRDSPQVAPPARAGSGSRGVQGGGITPGSGRVSGEWPVSYTHLTLPTICSV
eukprot:4982595-Alexandrium_andersonii.AAC.1